MEHGDSDGQPIFLNPISALTEVRLSPPHGLGIFATTLIPRDTIWWRARRSDVVSINRLQFEAIAASEQSPQIKAFIEAFLEFGFYIKRYDTLFLIPDNGRYVNHSFEPNSAVCPDLDGLCSITLRDIAAGGEICEDYRTYDKCPWANLYGEFGRTIGHWVQSHGAP